LSRLIWIIVAILTSASQVDLRIEYAHGTMIIVSATKSSIIIGADSGLVSSSSNGEAISNRERKIFPIGRNVACFLTGTISVSFPGSAEKINLPNDVRRWAAQHPHAGVRDAYQGLTDLVETKHANARSREPQPHSITSVGCVGFDMGTPIVIASDFYVQADSKPKIIKTENSLLPGLVIPLGPKVATEILRGEGNALASFKSEAIIHKYREAREKGTLASLTERDLILLSSACLNDSETRAARDFDPQAVEISGPNHFAVINQSRGFRWVSP